MLHDMLRAAAATEDRLIGEAKTARLLRKLPLADLYKLATEGTLGGEEVDGDSWVTRFAGTPLAGAATELATQELELETQIAQNRALGEGVLQQKDQLSIQKRLLDIELVRAQTEEAEKAQAAEAEQQQQAAAQDPAAPPQGADQAAPPEQPPAGAPPGVEGAPPVATKTAGVPDMQALERAATSAYGAGHWRAAQLGGNVGGAVGGLGGLAHGLQKDEEGKRHWGRGIAEGIGGSFVGGHLGGTVGGTVSRVRAGEGLLGGVKGHYVGLKDHARALRDGFREMNSPLKTAAITEKALDALKKGLAVDHRAVSAAARRHLEDVDAGSKSPGGEKKEAAGLIPAKATGLARVGQVFSGSRIPKLEHASDMLTRAGKRTSGDVLQRAADGELLKTVGARGAVGLAGATAVGVGAKKLMNKKPEGGEPAAGSPPAAKVAGMLDTAKGLITRGHELVTGSRVPAIKKELEGKVKELGNARDVALHRSAEAEKVLSRGPSIYKGKEILPGPTREARMRAAREVNEHGAAATRLGKEITDTTAATAAAAKTEARKVTGTRAGLVAAPLALGAAAATCTTCGGAHASADHPKIASGQRPGHTSARFVSDPETFADELNDVALRGDFGPIGVDALRRSVAETVGAYRGFADEAKGRLDASNAHPVRHQLGTGLKGGLAGAAVGGLALGGLAHMGGGIPGAAGVLGAIGGGLVGGGIGLYRGAPSSRAQQHKEKTERADRHQQEADALEARGHSPELRATALRALQEGMFDSGDRERVTEGLLRHVQEERLRGKTAGAVDSLLASPAAGKAVNFAIAHPTAAAGIAGGAVGGVGGALSTDAQGKHSLGRVAAGAAGGAALAAGGQQAYANRGAISEAAQKAVAGVKSRFSGAKPAAAVDPGAGI